MVRNWEGGWQPGRARIFHSPFRLTVSKALVRSAKAAYRPMFCSLHFSCICLSTKIMSAVPLLDLNPHWLSGVFSCAIVGMSLFSKTRTKILHALESSDASVVWTVWFSPLFLYRQTMTASLRSCGSVPFSQQLVNRCWSLSSTASPPCW